MKNNRYSIIIWVGLLMNAFPSSASVVHSGKSVTVVRPLDVCSSVQVQNGTINTGTARAVIGDTYFDALGHQSLSVLHKGSSTSKDLVIDYEYNFSGNVTRVSRPLPVSTSNTIQAENIPTMLVSYYDDSAPYSSYTYESTSAHRTLTEVQPGNSYQIHPATYTYGTNTTGEVACWTITSAGLQRSGYHLEETLSSTTKTDAAGASVTVFTNMLGQTVMRRQGDGETYYVYDSFGRLRYILPPAVSAQLGNGTYADSNETLRLYAYLYRYDRKGQLTTKRLPGCDTISYEYNSLGQLVYTQDGNQRERGDYWIMTEYDDLGRKTTVSEVNRSDASYTKPLQQFYYDDYTCLQALTQSQQNNLAFKSKSGYASAYSSPLGLPTMTITYGLTSSAQDIEVFYYDYQGRCVQKQQIAPTLGHSQFFYAYNFDGTLSKQWQEQSAYAEAYTYSYDHLGRPTTTQYRFDTEPTVTQSVCMYNEIGQQYRKTFHNGNLNRVDSFDIRGNLIKRTENGFTERLYYADNLPSGAIPHYNGLISASSVTQGYENVSFTYQYDNQNRLTYAQGNNKCQEQFEYDEMGNIWYMTRKNEEGYLDVLFCDHRGNQLVEVSDAAGNHNYYNTKEYRDASNADTTMYYDKNGTIIVDMDRNICAIRNNILNLPDTVQFVNGNQIINSYDAMGRKRSTTYRTLTTPTVVPVGSVLSLPSNSFTSQTTYYSGNMELRYGSPATTWTYHTPVGYVKVDDLDNEPRQYYYVHDHLGNVSAVWSADAFSFVQKTFYYPSGVPINNSSGQALQSNKYNGKPYEEMHGFDIYEYEFRNYYATIMRFTAMDPLCEQTPWQSPYTYAANNPVCNVDWMGLDGEAYSTNDENAINSLFDCFFGGGALYEYDPEANGWTNVSDEINWEDTYWNLIFYFSIANVFPGAGPTPDTPGEAAVVDVIGHYIKMSKDDSFSTSNLNNLNTIINTISTGIGGWELSQQNPAYWVGKNGVRYPTSLRRGPRRYVYNRSYEIKNIKINRSPLHKINRRLGYISIAFDAADTYNNGLRLGTTVNACVTVIGMYGGPWGTLFAGVYTITDIGVDLITGESITERLNSVTMF